jgi:hypothetical protein
MLYEHWVDSQRLRSYGYLKLNIIWNLLLIVSMGWDDLSEQRPPSDPLFVLQVRYEYGELRWNDTDMGNRWNDIKNLCQWHCVHQKLHVDRPGRERGGRRLTTWAMAQSWFESYVDRSHSCVLQHRKFDSIVPFFFLFTWYSCDMFFM